MFMNTIAVSGYEGVTIHMLYSSKILEQRDQEQVQLSGNVEWRHAQNKTPRMTYFAMFTVPLCRRTILPQTR